MKNHLIGESLLIKERIYFNYNKNGENSENSARNELVYAKYGVSGELFTFRTKKTWA